MAETEGQTRDARIVNEATASVALPFGGNLEFATVEALAHGFLFYSALSPFSVPFLNFAGAVVGFPNLLVNLLELV